LIGGTAGVLAVVSGHVMRPSRAVQAEPSFQHQEQQVPNRTAKADRWPVPVALPSAEHAAYSLASATSHPELERDDGVTRAIPVVPRPAPPRADTSPASAGVAKHAALPTAPKPPEQSRRLPPPAPSVLLDDTHIASIRARLRLTSEQAGYWPAVESALREVARTQLRTDRMQRSRDGKANINVNSPEVQRLVWAAMPLLMRLREDQKHEVRKLARVIGLESVASQI
jgi:hypothetical protein